MNPDPVRPDIFTEIDLVRELARLRTELATARKKLGLVRRIADVALSYGEGGERVIGNNLDQILNGDAP